jgi:hypothetical protein
MIRLISFWVCCCANFVCAGWVLSALHQLNASGFAVDLLVAMAALVLWRKKFPPIFGRKFIGPKFAGAFRALSRDACAGALGAALCLSEYGNVPLNEGVADHRGQVFLAVPLVLLVGWGRKRGAWCISNRDDECARQSGANFIKFSAWPNPLL